MKKNGFVSMTLVVTFLVLFLFLMLAILLAYSQRNRYIDAIDKNIDITIDSPHKFEYCPYTNHESFGFEFTGSPQTFIAGCSGKYQIELWGAIGAGTRGGQRAYTSGIIKLKQNDKLYVYVGEAGKVSDTFDAISFNGNITGVQYSGGGSTDVRLKNSDTWNDIDSLTSRIMVAAGGGGSASSSYFAGYGGEEVGNDASNGTKGGAKIVGQSGKSSTFGVANANGGENSSSGGGGYFAGESGIASGGGSSYVSGHAGCVAVIREGSSQPREITGAVISGDGNSQHTANTVCTEDSNNLECSIHYSGYIFENTVLDTYTTHHDFYNPVTHQSYGSNYKHGFAMITFISNE